VGFYIDSVAPLNLSSNDNTNKYYDLPTDEIGWRYRPIQYFDKFRDPDALKMISQEMFHLYEDPSNRQNGVCFDLYQYDGNLLAMKRSITMILQELEENDGKKSVSDFF
jgi:hypothetical protein